jgi:hypothetical protein
MSESGAPQQTVVLAVTSRPTSATGYDLLLSSRLQDQVRDRVGLRYEGTVARLYLDRSRAHALRHEALEIRWSLETKGREDFDTEVARKDAHAEWWCSQVTAQTGVSWKYAKLPYRRFHAKWPQTFVQLTEMLKPAPGLNLIFESKTTTADAASWWL